MSKYTTYYITRQQQYRELATSWKNITSSMNLTEDQKKGMALFFKSIAKRFGLIQEFRDIGVI